MRKFIFTIALFIFGFSGLFAVTGPPAHAFDPFGPDLCKTDQQKASPACQKDPNTCDDPITGKCGDGILIKATNILSLVIGIAAVIMIMIGGILYALSSGDSSRINQAKNTILFALIGLAIAALAQSIIRFVLVRLV